MSSLESRRTKVGAKLLLRSQPLRLSTVILSILELWRQMIGQSSTNTELFSG
ncbi:hypothetical protein FOTG_18431 [Fusarium oxysporum f. sp. vasinfectum 25433]|uniref:Uncharacterized protein n=1 Tax=Fusarium oxysporum f. sp. vasinfectum 25433 TaxID=1089449 RepID=X0KWD4_FUSOX|nr:hypothetical protein FOTG_18431 [Fusarium oxysporum f. sp. vasinfectum 25433]